MKKTKAASSLDMKAIGRRVHEIRLMREYTQRTLGEKIIVSANYIGEIERGKGNPSIQVMFDIARALDVSLDYILTGEESTEQRRVDYIEVPENKMQRLLEMMRLSTELCDSMLEQDN